MINVKIIYALPEKPTIIDCLLEHNSHVLQAITKSGILSQCHITLQSHKIGIYGCPVELTTQLKDGDQIEIYRELINDPKEIRKRRVAQKNRE